MLNYAHIALWAGIKQSKARLLVFVLMLIRLCIFGWHAEGEGESSLCKLTHKCYMSVELTACRVGDECVGGILNGN